MAKAITHTAASTCAPTLVVVAIAPLVLLAVGDTAVDEGVAPNVRLLVVDGVETGVPVVAA